MQADAVLASFVLALDLKLSNKFSVTGERKSQCNWPQLSHVTQGRGYC